MDIQARYRQITAFLLRYKWFSFLLLAIFFFLLLIVLTSQQQLSPQPNSNQQPTIQPINQPTTQQPQPSQKTETSPSEAVEVDGLTRLSKDTLNIQRVENLPDGTTKYTRTSDVSSRPDIIILRGRNDVFTRSVSSPNAIPSLSSYLEVFGSPTRIFKGSKYYGLDAQWYLYPDSGAAFVTKNGQVLELHVFYSTTLEDYLNKFGDDIIR